MNKDELQGGARYYGGKVEKTVGDVARDRDLQTDGIVDQVAGAAQHTYGRARSVVEDVVDHAPHLAEKAGEQVRDAAARVADQARHGGAVAARTIEDTPLLWALGAAVVGYGLAWLIHGTHD